MRHALRSSATRPDLLLRVEAICALVLCVSAYQQLFPRRWGWFALLFLFPDIALIAYASGPSRAASALYNLFHNYAVPLVVGMMSWYWHRSPGVGFGLIWAAHIAFDRVLGYGLKFPGTFKTTHIQRSASL